LWNYTVPCKLAGVARERRAKRAGTWDARAVRALRRHMNLSQDGLAAALGTRQQTVSEWETGRYRPRGTSATLLSIIAERAEFEYQAGKPQTENRKAENGPIAQPKSETRKAKGQGAE
jgi:DNA-binding transcriptional regulator YiaG